MKLSVVFVFSVMILSAHGIPDSIKGIIKEVITSLAKEEEMVLETAKMLLPVELNALRQTGISFVKFGRDMLSIAFIGEDLEKKVNGEVIADGGMNEICVNAHMNNFLDLIDTNTKDLANCEGDLLDVFIPNEQKIFDQIKALLQVQKDILSRFKKCVKELLLAGRCMSKSEEQTKTDITKIQTELTTIKTAIADIQTNFTTCQAPIVAQAKNQSSHIFWEFQICQHQYIKH